MSTYSVKSNSATPEELVSMASEIWRKVRNEISQEKNQNDVMAIIYNEYKDFYNTFPIVVRWMINFNQYSSKVFKSFLDVYKNTKINERNDFLELQSLYLMKLHEHYNPHLDKTSVYAYKKQIFDALIAEDKEFKELVNKTKEEIDTENEESRQNKINSLKACLIKQTG